MSSVNTFLIPKPQRPWWLRYPKGLVDLVEKGEVKFSPWEICTAEESLHWAEFFRKRLPGHLIPFAHHVPTCEFACLKRFKFGGIVLVSDESTSEFPVRVVYRDFDEWLRAARAESQSWIEDERRYEESEREKHSS